MPRTTDIQFSATVISRPGEFIDHSVGKDDDKLTRVQPLMNLSACAAMNGH